MKKDFNKFQIHRKLVGTFVISDQHEDIVTAFLVRVKVRAKKLDLVILSR
jgi:hypothetical protein